MPSLGFEQPLVLAALLALPLLAALARPRLRAMPPWQRRSVVLLRAAILGLLVAALASPTVGDRAPPAPAVVFAVDASGSLAPRQQAGARDWVRRAAAALGPQARWSVVDFAEQARLGALDAPAAADLSRAATSLEAALRLAGALLPSEGRREIVLLTDGRETVGRAETPGLVPDGVAVSFVVPDQSGVGPEVAIRSVDVAPAVRAGETLDVAVVVESTEPMTATLRLWLDDAPVADRAVVLLAGANRFTLSPRVQAAGFRLLSAEVLPQADLRSENNRLEALTVAREGGRVLLLAEAPGQAAALAETLAADGLQVETRLASSLPPEPGPLRELDALVLVNVPATALSLDQQRTLQAAVRDLGRGLVVMGGARSFAPGGYEGSVLDEMLPVSAEPPPQRQQGSVALLLVIDKSGSMDTRSADGVAKIVMAREAARQAADLLRAGDVLGVAAFDTTFQWIVPPARLSGAEDLRSAQAQIASLQADGGTEIYPVLEAAYQAAAEVEAQARHIVLLSDGQAHTRSDYDALLRRLAPHQITLSSVAIGSDADRDLLTRLARLGQGRSYFTERSTQIPRIANQETTILTRQPVVEGRLAPLLMEPSPLLRGLSGTFPALHGYVATTPRPRAVTALGTERGHPLLAHWQYGLGRAVAWTSDAQGAWTSEWAEWPERSRFWSDSVRWAMPAPRRPDLRVAARVEGRRVTLQADSLLDDGRFGDLLDTRAIVVGPDGVARELVVPQRAPGSYERTAEVGQPGAYRVLFSQREAGRVVREEMAGFVVPSAPELRSVGPDPLLLGRLAARSGGRELREPVDLLRPPPGAGPEAPTERRVPLWPWLVGAAMVLLPLDVAARRLPWPPARGGAGSVPAGRRPESARGEAGSAPQMLAPKAPAPRYRS